MVLSMVALLMVLSMSMSMSVSLLFSSQTREWHVLHRRDWRR